MSTIYSIIVDMGINTHMENKNYNLLFEGICKAFGLDFTEETTVGEIDRVIFSPPATIVLWADGTRTVVKAQDEYDREKGLALCIAKKALGNKGNYYNVFKRFLEPI